MSSVKPLELSFNSRHKVVEALRGVGCSIAVVKLLAPRQDNEKNQIYLGSAVLLDQLLPGKVSYRGGSKSTNKRSSKPGSPIVETQLHFSWLWPGNQVESAPSAKLINYFQYPEVRLSGFIRDCPRAPRCLRREEQSNYGRRLLVLGVAADQTFGIALTDLDGPRLIDEFLKLPKSTIHDSLRDLPLGSSGHSRLDKTALLLELSQISGESYPPLKLDTNDSTPQQTTGGTQYGGWTLEALLGVPRNSEATSDKYGFEIKSVSSSKVSIITSEADLGYRSTDGFKSFMARYGKPSTKTAGKTVFNGVHRIGKTSKSTGGTLVIDHWDDSEHEPSGSGEPTVLLLDSTDRIMAGWSFSHLGEHWSKKHGGGAYIETKGIKTPNDKFPTRYTYGPLVGIGTGTSVLHLLGAISRGIVYLDPGDRIDSSGASKARTQWRVSGNLARTLEHRLRTLYDSFEMHNISTSPSRSRVD